MKMRIRVRRGSLAWYTIKAAKFVGWMAVCLAVVIAASTAEWAVETFI